MSNYNFGNVDIEFNTNRIFLFLAVYQIKMEMENMLFNLLFQQIKKNLKNHLEWNIQKELKV